MPTKKASKLGKVGENEELKDNGEAEEKHVEELAMEAVVEIMRDKEDAEPSKALNMDLVAMRNLKQDFLKTGPSEEDTAAALGKVLHIRLDRERISTIGEYLPTMTHITNLYLQCNRLEDISGLQSLTTLRFLTVAENFLRDVKGLSALPNLMFVDVSNNQLEEVEALVDDLPTSVRFVNIKNNPMLAEDDGMLIAREALAAALPRLKQLDGYTITSLEKRAARSVYGVPAFSDEEDEDDEEEEEEEEDEDENAGSSANMGEAGGAGVAAAALGALKATEDSEAANEQAKLKAVLDSCMDPSVDANAVLEATVLDARREFSRQRDRIIQRSRMRIDDDRKDQVKTDEGLKDMKNAQQDNMRVSLNLSESIKEGLASIPMKKVMDS